MDNFYFVKQNILEFLTTIYIKNKKIEEKESQDIMLILKDVIRTHLEYYV